MAHASTPFKPANPGWYRVKVTNIAESVDRFKTEEGKPKRYEFELTFADPNKAGTAKMLYWAGATFASRTDKTPSNLSRLLSAVDPDHKAHNPITGDWNELPDYDATLGLNTLYGLECDAQVVQTPHKDDSDKMVSKFVAFRPCAQATPAKPSTIKPSTPKKMMSFITGEKKPTQSAPAPNPTPAEIHANLTRAKAEIRQAALARKEAAAN